MARSGIGGLGLCCQRLPCLCNLVDFRVLTLLCQSKEARGGPGRITLEGKKSPAFGVKKMTKLSTKMAQKERKKTLDDFSHLAVLSLSGYSVCFTTNGLTAFLGEELECSFNLCLVVKATTATNLLQPDVDDVNS